MSQQPSEHGGFRIRSHINRSPSDCRLVDDAIDEYALGTIDSGRRAAIERHLTRCPQCAALVKSYQNTTAVLALAVPLAMPPASARTALFDRIAQTSQTSPMTGSVYAGNLDAFRSPTLPTSSGLAAMQPAQPEDQPSWWRVYAAPLATLPLLLALGLVAAWGLNNYSELHSSKNALAQSELQIARMASQLSTENSQGVTSLAFSSSSKRYNLTPEVSGAGDSGQGTLIAEPGSDQAALQVSGLPAGTYSVVVQLQNGDMVPKTEFEVGTDGTATTLVDLGSQVTDLASVHIRPTNVTTVSDVADVGAPPNSLMAVIGPSISDDSDTSVQNP